MASGSSPGHSGHHASARGEVTDYRPHRLLTLWRSTLGKKYVVALSGVLLVGFVFAHMLGNLKALEGPGAGHPAIDRYGHFLRTLGAPVLPHDFALWVERIVLLLALIVHVTAIIQLWRRNRRARPPHSHRKAIRSTISARTMKLSGFLVLIFTVFHVLHFSTRTIHPTSLAKDHIYANAFGAFHKWWIVVIYVAAVVLLGLHMNHGLWSAAQTGGFDNPDRNWFWRRLATGATVAVVVGFAAIPILFATGALPKPASSRVSAAVVR